MLQSVTAWRWLRRYGRRGGQVVVDTVAGAWRDGFTNAGNLAYLSLLTLFPFFIVLGVAAGAFGRTDGGLHAVHLFLRTLPQPVAVAIATPVADVLGGASHGSWLTFSLLVMLWTISGAIESIRAILRHAYAAEAMLPFWRYRMGSILLTFAAVGLMLFGLALQLALTGAEAVVVQLLPKSLPLLADVIASGWGIGRLTPALVLLGSLYLIFYALTPRRFRGRGFRVVPGAALTTLVWVATTSALPWILGQFGDYNRTYGSLGGVIVVLLFFYLIGFGLVFGAHFNAALAKQSILRQNDHQAN